MFGLGMPELILILVIALVIFGPSKLPEMGASVGKVIREFRSATNYECHAGGIMSAATDGIRCAEALIADP